MCNRMRMSEKYVPYMPSPRQRSRVLIGCPGGLIGIDHNHNGGHKLHRKRELSFVAPLLCRASLWVSGCSGEEEEDLFVFNDTVEGPRAPAAQSQGVVLTDLQSKS